MINLHKSMGPGRDQTRDPWVCSQIASTFMFLFVLLDDDGDGVAEEDCATPPPSKYNNYSLKRQEKMHLKMSSAEVVCCK